MIERLAEKYAHSVPEYQLVKYSQVAVPVYKVVIQATVLHQISLGVVEEFILKLIDSGIQNIQDLVGFLGLDDIIVSDALTNLFKDDLVFMLSGTLHITDKGRECLQELRIHKTKSQSYTFVIDAMTGEYALERSVPCVPLKTVKEWGIHPLKALIKKPSIRELDVKKISDLFKQDPREETEQQKLVSVNEMMNCYVEYKKMNLLVFAHRENQDEIEIKVFERFDPAPEYESIILRMEQEGIRQIPTDKRNLELEVDDEQRLFSNLPRDVVESATANKKWKEQLIHFENMLAQRIGSQSELSRGETEQDGEDASAAEIRMLKEQLAVLKKRLENQNQFLETYDHRPLLEKSLREAEKFVVIVSPWLRFSGLDKELQKLIEQALHRKVQIIIGYGISEEDPGNRNAERILYKMKKKKEGKYLTLIKLGNTHEKVLLVDGKYVVITSFNWLSFKGDPNRGFRQETGIYTEDQKTIEKTIHSLEQRMEINIRRFIS